MTLHPESLLLISGPTAVGKSELALSLAGALGGEIVNIDSVQMYRALDIGSAKPTLAEQSLVPHHLLDVLSPAEQGTVARYIAAAESTIAELRSRGILPIVTGGTGLYVTALLHGLADLPRVDSALRKKLEARSIEDLRADLRSRDPESAASIAENDRVRTIRALETSILSGVKASELRAAHGHRTSRMKGIILVPLIDRELLYRRIEARAVRMVAAGLVEEVRSIQRDFGASAPALDAIGYREVVEMLAGNFPESELADRIALNTRRFAKRQMTFWRNEPGKRGWGIRPAPGERQVHITGNPASKRAPVKPIPALALDRETLTAHLRDRLSQPLERSEVWFLHAGAELAS